MTEGRMTPPRQVPRIGRGPMVMQQPQQPYMQQFPMLESVDDSNDLAMEIYARLAVDHIRTNQATDPETLRELARSAQTASLTYFEQLGVQFDTGTNTR